MFHHHSTQQGQQPFSKGTRPPQHQPPPDQHPSRTPSEMLSQVIGFQFPRPTQLPDELESALAIRGARDMDHRLVDHMTQQKQHQNQDSGSGISQHGSYGARSGSLSSDNQQGVDWASFQPPTKLFVSPPSSEGQHSQQPSTNTHAGANLSSWTDSTSPQTCLSVGASGGEGQSLYTPESAGSILASFGLSNEDLEVLSHYPDDQLTPDTLPFILRDIQINKSGNQKNLSSAASSSFSHGLHDITSPTAHSLTLTRSQSLEVPSLLTVTQTAGKVIDYGHASRANEENRTREAFKREPLSTERTVKMFPSSATKMDKSERRQVNLEHTEPNKHGDQDYRRTSSQHCKSHRSPGREFPPSSKARNLDQDYRRDKPKPRMSSEIRREDSSRRSLSSSSDSKPLGSSKKFPTPTMISDFSAVSPRLYPHTCSLCHTQCDQEKDWVDHVNTVSHTAACRDLRNKYPAWKPSRSSGRYGSQALGDPKRGSPPHSSRSLSSSPSSSPHSKYRGAPLRPRGRKSYSPHIHPRHHYTEHRPDYSFSASRPFHTHQTSSSCSRAPPEKRCRESAGSSSRGVKRSHDPAATEANRQLSVSQRGMAQSSSRAVRSGTKSGPKMAKMASAKSGRSPPAKKKKRTGTRALQDGSVADRLVYLTDVPNDATEQEVTDLVRSFGNINNVLLMPGSEEESETAVGRKLTIPRVHASVCMVKAEDAQALANSTTLCIRGQKVTASLAKKPEGQSSNTSRPAPGQDKGCVGGDSGEADQRSSERGTLLVTGLPESGWSESDIVALVQPFGTPSDIIVAAKIGKVLVSVPDLEMAQEMVKVHTLMPAKVKDTEVKLIQLKQRICLSSPVALYNVLMGSLDPEESPAPVGWSSLLVISNVPNMSASSVVQKLVQRFGTVIKTLVLNNMVICEMATAATSLSVYKRFQTFPCTLHNNPLLFFRRPDPKAPTKVIAACADLSEETPANGNDGKTAHGEKTECHLGDMKKGVDDDDGKEEKMTDEDETFDSKVEEMKNDQVTEDVSEVLALSDPTQEGDVDTDMKKTSTVKTETEEYKGAENKIVAPSGETVPPELHKVTQEMVNALLVECRTKMGSQPSKPAASAWVEEQEGNMETRQRQNIKEQAQKHLQEEKKPDREKKERPARKEIEERERREKERRTWEKEERRERERRGRKRAFPGSRSSLRSQEHKQSSRRDEPRNQAEPRTDDEFPFNMSEFVTVDEVGDVTDLPCSPSSVPMETTERHPPVDFLTGSDAAKPPEQESPMSVVVAATAAPSPEPPRSSQPHHICGPEATEVLSHPPDAASEDLSTCPATDEKGDEAVSSSRAEEETVLSDKTGRQEDIEKEAPAETGKHEGSEDQTNVADKSVKEDAAMSTNHFLPPYDSSNPVGMDFLIPKTGFFCKVCNRFFSGNKEAEINHCKTFKHYDNLQKYFQTMKAESVTAKPDSS